MGYKTSDFYNPDIKLAFLESRRETMQEQSLLSYERLFATFKRDEELYGMDFCDFNYSILMTVLSLRLSRGRGSKQTQLSLLRSYVNWCIANGVKKNDENPIQNIKSEEIDSSIQIRRQFVKDPIHLQEILDNVLEATEDQSGNGIMYRMTCMLLYEGFTEQEVMDLRKTDVNFENNTINSPDGSKTIAVSEQLMRLISKAIDLTYVLRPNQLGGMSQLSLENSDRLFRKIGRKDSSNTAAYLRAKLAVLKKEYARNTYESISLASNRIWLAGMFYRLYQKEKSGSTLTDEDFMFGINEEIQAESIKMKVYHNKLDYQDWKQAYKLG